MCRRLIVLLLLCTVLGQSCWAFGEVLHHHDPQDSSLSSAAMSADLHFEMHQHDDCCKQQQADPDQHVDHHHSCTSHSPFGPPALVLQLASPGGVLASPYLQAHAPDAPLDGIDRPNWRAPA